MTAVLQPPPAGTRCVLGAATPCPLHGGRTDALRKHVSAELSHTTDSCTELPWTEPAQGGAHETAADAAFLYQN